LCGPITPKPVPILPITQRAALKDEKRSNPDAAVTRVVMIGNPKACRAVGMANNRNPIAIIVPCHRVIGHDGSLTGFGGGLELKQNLLDLENANCAEMQVKQAR
jgi:O-6-methylguanine DNA methyltransferase